MATEITDDEIKDLIAKPENRIKLHDLLHEETEKLFAVIDRLEIPAGSGEDVIAASREWIAKAGEAAANLMKIFAYGCYFGTDAQAYLWPKTLERLATPHNSTEFQRKLELYPIMLIMYAGGMSAIAAHNYSSVRSLLSSQVASEYSSEKGPLAYMVNGWLIDQQTANVILELSSRTPISEQVFKTIAKVLPPSLISEPDLSTAFNDWDILLSMTVAHHTSREEAHRLWVPVGRFAWHRDSFSNIQRQLDLEGADWPILSIGMFDRDLNKAKEALKATQEAAKGV